jgi:hypothetical protein
MLTILTIVVVRMMRHTPGPPAERPVDRLSRVRFSRGGVGALDAFVVASNTDRPHQSLDIDIPPTGTASRFMARTACSPRCHNRETKRSVQGASGRTTASQRHNHTTAPVRTTLNDHDTHGVERRGLYAADIMRAIRIPTARPLRVIELAQSTREGSGPQSVGCTRAGAR